MNIIPYLSTQNTQIVDEFSRLNTSPLTRNNNDIGPIIDFVKNHSGLLGQNGETEYVKKTTDSIIQNNEMLSKQCKVITESEASVKFEVEQLNIKIKDQSTNIEKLQNSYNELHANFERNKNYKSLQSKKARQAAKSKFLYYQKETNKIRDQIQLAENECNRFKSKLGIKNFRTIEPTD